MFAIKFELEDIALKQLHPDFYKELAQQINQRKEQREEYINKIIRELSKALDTLNIHYCLLYTSIAGTILWQLDAGCVQIRRIQEEINGRQYSNELSRYILTADSDLCGVLVLSHQTAEEEGSEGC